MSIIFPENLKLIMECLQERTEKFIVNEKKSVVKCKQKHTDCI